MGWRALSKLSGMSRLRHLGWNQCSHGLSSRPLESCHHQCLQAICGVLGYPKGSALELLDGTLKLRHCTEVFTMRFLPWSLPRVGHGGGKRQLVTTGHLPDASSAMGKRVRLTRKTRPGVISHIPDPGQSTPRRWKRLRSPLLRRRGGRGGRASQSFSSPWGWVMVLCTWGRLEPAFGGNRRRGFRLVSPAEGTGALALVRFN